MFPAASQLRTAYVETDYVVRWRPREYVIRTGHRCAPVEHLLSRYKTRSAAFVTAWNPLGKKFSRTDNTNAQRRLLAALRLKGFPSAQGEGRGRVGNWAPEHSVLVFGLERSEAARLGRSLRQNAVVFVRTGRPAELLLLR
jgi:hypothetical protein